LNAKFFALFCLIVGIVIVAGNVFSMYGFLKGTVIVAPILGVGFGIMFTLIKLGGGGKF